MIELQTVDGRQITLFINWISEMVAITPHRTKLIMNTGREHVIDKSKMELKLLIEFELGYGEEE